MVPILAAAGWLLSSSVLASCGAAGPRGSCRPDSSGAPLVDGELRIERALHQLDILEADIYSFKDAPGHPIDACIRSDSDVVGRDLAWTLAMGVAFAGQDKAAEKRYYSMLQEGTPAELMPLVYLRKYYHEGLERCVLALVHGTPREVTEESDISILSTANFEAETSKGTVVVDFMTHWCVPCKKMARDLERLAREYKGRLKVGRLNVDRHMAMGERFGVKAFPTLLMFRNGQEVARLSDSHTYSELKAWAERVLPEQGSD